MIIADQRNRVAAAQRQIRVAVLEPDELLREGLTSLIDSSSAIQCVGDYPDARSGLAGAAASKPDVILLDVHLPGLMFDQMLTSLREAAPNSKVIVMVNCREETCVVRRGVPVLRNDGGWRCIVEGRPVAHDDCLELSLKLGASGVIRKPCAFSRIEEAVCAVHAGRIWMEPHTAERLAARALPNRADAHGLDTSALTPREEEIVGLIAAGRSNKEIANDLDLGYSTIKNYVSSILRKLNLDGRTQLALYAVQGGRSQIAPGAES